MTRQQLIDQIFEKKSYLCIGLDTDLQKIPEHLKSASDPVFEFNRQIIDATKNFCVSYKINTAFYEAQGLKGWSSLEKTLDHIPETHFRIADAKRGDIGNTSAQYAKAFFQTLGFDAVTVAPYMGEDSIKPFLEYSNKWTIVLGLTSNAGAYDFEMQKVLRTYDILEEGVHIQKTETSFLYETVLEKVKTWGTLDNLMFVIGATQADSFTTIRERIPDHFFLVPGVGSQGGSIKEISQTAMIKDCGLIVNASRTVIYASDGEDFAEASSKVARQYAEEMKKYLVNKS